MNQRPPSQPQPAIANLAISASAGSGKTFQLAHRYIRLLAGGVAPDRICAMTFSRKAAGEIFEKVVAYLVEASGDDAAARAVSKRMGIRSPGAAAYLDSLRGFVNHLHRLHIGTLDSFMVGVLRAFPAELGVAPDFQVMDGDGAAAADLQRDVLQRILNPQMLDAGARAEFLEAFKQATFGREEKEADAVLDTFIADHRARYQNLPDAGAWGPQARIWPQGCAWLDGDVNIAAASDALAAGLAHTGWDENARARWEAYVAAARAFSSFSPWSAEIVYLFPRLAAVCDVLPHGRATIKIGRKAYTLDATLGAAALETLRHLVATECRTALASTHGLHRVLAQFDAVYDVWARRTGRLTFTDAQYLLTESNRHSGGALLSRVPNRTGRLYIDYRLDARLDHWLLDEFQDTSDLQWAAIRNLVDEVLQDDSGQRSFFYVGDVKQAIYGWRGGNPRLFGNILRTYRQRITVAALNTSFRSCPPVLDCVNAVFDGLAASAIPADVCQRWADIWNTHVASAHTAQLPGHAALLEAGREDGSRAEADDRYRLAAALIRELDPLRRRLTVAVLVRSNAQGRAVVEALRRACPGLPVVHEGNAPLNDSPVVTLLLALVRHAAHPGDRLAARHLQMSPLAPELAALCPGPQRAEALLRQIHERGFQPFLRDWGQRLRARVPLDPFGWRRLEDLLAAAGEFDADGERDGGAFLRFMEHYAISETAGGLAVRVMTVHQSKGLGFDVVVLPDLQSRQILTAGALDLVTHRDAQTDRPEWVLKLPRRAVAECDEVLHALVQHEDRERCFDELCVLYVALTRAKQALYLIASSQGKDSKSYTPAALLKHRLAGDPNPAGGTPVAYGETKATLLYAAGSPDWYAKLPVAATPETRDALPPAEAPAVRPPAQRRAPLEPSAHDTVTRRAARLFSRDSRDALDFGSAIHTLFERVEWSDACEPVRLLAEWERTVTLSAAVRGAVAAQFQRCLQDATVRAVLAKPAGACDLWRELRFELLLGDDEWVRGAFDRVVVHLGPDGRARQAAIIDFKSDDVGDAAGFQRAAEGYRSQLALYARAVSQILNLPKERIAQTLVFTRAPRVCVLAEAQA